MRAMWLAFATIGIIAVVAGVVLTNLEYSTAQRYSTENVRLN